MIQNYLSKSSEDYWHLSYARPLCPLPPQLLGLPPFVKVTNTYGPHVFTQHQATLSVFWTEEIVPVASIQLQLNKSQPHWKGGNCSLLGLWVNIYCLVWVCSGSCVMIQFSQLPFLLCKLDAVMVEGSWLLVPRIIPTAALSQYWAQNIFPANGSILL